VAVVNGLLILIAVVVVGVPLTAVALVSIAVFREQSRHSLIGRAPGPIERTARRMLAFHSECRCEPTSQADARRRPGMAGGGALFPVGALLPPDALLADKPA
jgi:hypothetical protein